MGTESEGDCSGRVGCKYMDRSMRFIIEIFRLIVRHKFHGGGVDNDKRVLLSHQICKSTCLTN